MIDTSSSVVTRAASVADVAAIARIYNEGIADRLATLDEDEKSEAEMRQWFTAHDERYGAIVAERFGRVVGWASLTPYSHRCAFSGVAELSVYVARDARRTGVGRALLAAIDAHARRADFHKIVLFSLAQNDAGQRLYRRSHYREVGVFREHGRLDGRFVDIVAMEKLVKPIVLFVCRHNTGRSQMAEAFLREFAGDSVDVFSAGTIAADRPDPGVVAAMAEIGIDISAARPKLIDPVLVACADRVITMGCDVAGVERIDDDWGLPDPKGQSPERIREIRDTVRANAESLAREFVRSTRLDPA